MTNKRVHLPKRKGFFGRMEYSKKMDAGEWIDSNFDNCWKSITKLWILVITMIIIALIRILVCDK